MNHFKYEFPYPSQRMPVLAQNIVATSQPLASHAGLRMLLKGGNAVDAAIAAAITLAVVEPNNNGLGSDAFAIVWDKKELHGLNASGRSPIALPPDLFDGRSSISPYGWEPVTVPGAVSAWVELSTRFGLLPFSDLFEPALEYAEAGYLVSPITAKRWKEAEKTYKDFPDFASTFLPNGEAPKAGKKVVFKNHAQSLKRIMETEGEAFYHGDLAEKIADHAKATGGWLTMEDMANHKAVWVEPVSQLYHETTLHEIPPNGQGIAALMALGIMKYRDILEYNVDTADSVHIQIEAMKLAYRDTHRFVSDPRTMELGPANLLDPDYLQERAVLIDMKKAHDPSYGVPQNGGTVYLTTADANGMMVSYIQSNYMGFGSGIVVPDTGIALQNRGYGFTLEAGHPNRISGGKLPYHTIIPAFVTRKGEPLMSFGVMGGAMQPQGHVQMMCRIFDYAQNPQAASDAPRWRILDHNEVAFEYGFNPRVIEELFQRGHKIHMCGSESFGGAQLIYKLDDGYCGASDHRKDGQAVGF